MDMVDLSTVDAYLFDLGGVIVDISPDAAIDAFNKLGLKNLHEQITLGHHEGLFKKYEQGAVSTNEFIQQIQNMLPNQVSDQEIIDAWNQMLVYMPNERVEILERLRAKSPVFLLSNTNDLHRNKYVSMADAYDNVEPIFTKAFYSYEIEISKPDLESFQYVIDNSDLIPERTLFLDDSQLNLDAAKTLGFQIVLVSESNSMVNIFSKM
ncbi:HAD family hydrolase [Carboxylicivirga marina]|uniref:HAD family phosphatase n=1 Tax=Carboxylicivirga marina TaxID=2800988 RepID=A0ABS1HLW9_9BACT|nr:HAD family phosphatase [Carboxylicivirga marina]MBK3518542.1 HAD family phosphatase [Carboxylicivirga marina]